MNNEIDISKMPRIFAVCWNGECPLKDKCLRFIAQEKLPAERGTAISVNLHSVDWAGGQCTRFKAVTWDKNAYGIRHLLDEVPKKVASRLASELRALFGNRLYYHYYHSRKPVPPEHQAYIKDAFTRHCPQVEVRFDRFADEVNWD